MVEKLGLNFSDAHALNQIIEHKIPMGPEWNHTTVNLTDQSTSHNLYFCNVEDCIRDLYVNPTFADTMKYAPERHYSDDDKTSRIFHGMYTGDWMWKRRYVAVLLVSLSKVTFHYRVLSRLAAQSCH